MQRLRYSAVREPKNQKRRWCVKNEGFYICEIVPLGPHNEQELAERIARLLNEEEERINGAKQLPGKTSEERPLKKGDRIRGTVTGRVGTMWKDADPACASVLVVWDGDDDWSNCWADMIVRED